MSVSPTKPTDEATNAGLSFEGIPWSDYRWPSLLLALLPGFLIYACFRLYAWTLREEPLDGALPKNAILFFLHGDQFPQTMADQFWTRTLRNAGFVGLGYHGFLSYVLTPQWIMRGFNVFRFDRRRGRAKDQVMSFVCGQTDSTFGIQTDSGGPYGRVRESLVDMAIASGRPLVGVRFVASRSLALNHHQLPLPFSTIQVRGTRCFEASELRALGPERARELLQSAIEVTP